MRVGVRVDVDCSGVGIKNGISVRFFKFSYD